MKFLSFVSAGFIAVLLFAGCKRDGNGPGTPRSAGDFFAKADNGGITGHTFKAFYYPEYHQLFLVAQDADKRNAFEIYIALDSVDPLKNYPFSPNGSHFAELWRNCSSSYYSDLNDNTLSGSLQLLKLDTVNLKTTGNFSFKGYNYTRKEYVSVTEGRFEDIEVDTVLAPYIGNYLTADIGPVKFYTPDTYGSINGVSGGVPTLTVTATDGALTESFFDCNSPTIDRGRRELSFKIPLGKGPGTYTLTPDTWPYSSQWDIYHLNKYIARNENPYLPVSGSITITQLDTAARKLTATFELQAKDSTNKTISFSNGKIVLQGWSNF